MLPRSIWIIGFVSLFTDISSEIVHSLLPVYLVSVLGSSYTTVGLIEGLGEGTVFLFKILSGPISDRLKNRKTLVLIGYTMGALSKPLFAIAQSTTLVFGARLFDRMGKGIRGAPRDALIADIVPASIRGKAFGLRQSLDTTGAFLGPLLAIFLMYVLHENFNLIFWIATFPAFISVGLIIFGVQETKQRTPIKNNFSLKDLRNFDKNFWIVCLFGSILQLAKFSEAFLILRVKDFGLSFALIPLVLVGMNVVYAATAYPLGRLSDRIERKKLILIGFVVLIIADLILAFGTNLYWVSAGVALWGLQLGFTQSVMSALVVDNCPKEFTGTAFSIFNLFSAIALLISSPLAGFIWDKFGPPTTFMTSATIASVGLFFLFSQNKINTKTQALKSA